MGMFDRVFFETPCCCKNVVVQSKAGACIMCTYDETEVPVAIAGDIMNTVIDCPECSKQWRVRPIVPIPDSIPMGLVEP